MKILNKTIVLMGQKQKLFYTAFLKLFSILLFCLINYYFQLDGESIKYTYKKVIIQILKIISKRKKNCL